MSEETNNPTTARRKLDLNGDLSQQDALGVLIQGVRFAQSKGVFSLEDAALISKAIGVFIKKEDEAPGAGAPEQPVSQDQEVPKA